MVVYYKYIYNNYNIRSFPLWGFNVKGISLRFLEKKEIFVRVALWLHDVCDNISIQCYFRYYFFVFLKFDVFFFIFSKLIFILISKYKTNSLYRIFIVSIKREKKKFSVNSLINWSHLSHFIAFWLTEFEFSLSNFFFFFFLADTGMHDTNS